VTDTTDSIVTANTTYTVFSQWSSRSAEDVITRLQVQHSMCCHTKDYKADKGAHNWQKVCA